MARVVKWHEDSPILFFMCRWVYPVAAIVILVMKRLDWLPKHKCDWPLAFGLACMFAAAFAAGEYFRDWLVEVSD